MKYTLLVTGLVTLTLVGCDEAKRPITNSSPVSTDTSHTATNTNPAATDATVTEGDAVVKRDNTEVNIRDRSDAAKTPIDQNENQPDINITANVRKRVVDTKMSVNAQNVKIITQDGKVTLRGPVKSEDEKIQIDKIAREVAGPANVENLLEVQP